MIGGHGAARGVIQHSGLGGQGGYGGQVVGPQYGMQAQQQPGKDNIAYNVEHVFKDENGREVRKMPVDIDGETIWVECVPGGGSGQQDGGDGAIVLNMEDHEEIPKAVVKPPRSTPSTSSSYPPMGVVPQGHPGVTTEAMTPPTIDSPPCSSGGEGSSLSASSSGGSGSGQLSKRIPGKLAMCKFCGFTSEDLAVCVRCRRKIPDDVKILDDPSYKPKPDSTELMGTKKLRLHRIPGKRSRRPGNPEEPVCIALSSDEEGGEDDENSRTSNHEGNAADQQSRRVGVEEQGLVMHWCTYLCS